MRHVILACAATASALVSVPAQAERVVLQPSSEWELRAYDDKCRMIRTFGSGEDELTLWIDKGGPGPGVNLTLIGRAVRSPYGPYVRVGFVPGEAIERNFIAAQSSKGRPVMGLFGVQPVSLLAEEPEEPEPGFITPEEKAAEEQVDFSQGAPAAFASEKTIKRRMAEITALEVSGAVIDPIAIELDSFLPMANDLWECTATLTERLTRNGGRDSSSGGTPTTPLDAPVWARKLQENYPAHLVRAEQQGSVDVRLTVNKDGKASFCEVIAYSGPATFNDTACFQLLRHARFNPATDAAGNPVPSFYQTRITYRLND